MKNKFTKLSSLLILYFLCQITFETHAQDGHYWTHQYGTRSMLLSGSVIGGVEDLGAVFYNPGRLGLIKKPAFILSADVYEWNRFSITDAFGESADLSKSDFGGVPSLVAGTFKVGFLKNHSFAYAIIRRQDIDLDFTYKNEIFGELIERFPGEEYFGGSIRVNQKVREEWASLAWSFPLSEKISVGITSNLMTLKQSKGSNIELQALSSDKNVAIYKFERNISFNKYGFLWKAGLAGEFEKLMFGLTVTTPVIGLSTGLSNDGKYNYERFFSGIDEYSINEDVYTTSIQNNIEVEYRKPWAVGLGLTIPFNKNRIHLSSEWYNSVPRYTMMEVQDHYSQSNGDTIRFKLVDELKSVLNAGLGIEWYIQEKISFYASVSTDYSAVSENIVGFISNKDIAVNSVFSADYYHFGGGFVLDVQGADVTLGATFLEGQQDFARPVDFPEQGDDDIFEQDEIATLGWSRWQLVFSFSVPFLADRVKKVQKNLNVE